MSSDDSAYGGDLKTVAVLEISRKWRVKKESRLYSNDLESLDGIGVAGRTPGSPGSRVTPLEQDQLLASGHDDAKVRATDAGHGVQVRTFGPLQPLFFQVLPRHGGRLGPARVRFETRQPEDVHAAVSTLTQTKQWLEEREKKILHRFSTAGPCVPVCFFLLGYQKMICNELRKKNPERKIDWIPVFFEIIEENDQ